MRLVIWTDRDGFRHRSLLRDSDPDDRAPFGISADPPDLSMLDWDGVRRDLWNALVDRGICTWLDVQKGDVRASILNAMHRRVQDLYREVETHGKLSTGSDAAFENLSD